MNEQAKVAYLGPKGTFSQAAVISYFGENCSLHECASIEEVFSVVSDNAISYGVVPVENSTEGAVNNTQDCLIDFPVNIIGEVIVPIEHCLLVHNGTKLSDITQIASHQQSLAQCRAWIQKNLPTAKLIECSSNAEAAKLATENKSTAAIAGSIAAEVYALKILREKIQDQEHNSTRFLVLANEETASTGRDKTSVLIYAENKPGALFRILEPFENLKVSLTKIETRPAKVEAWAYVFFIDFEGHVKDELIMELFAKLDSCTAEIKVLGSYPVYQAKN